MVSKPEMRGDAAAPDDEFYWLVAAAGYGNPRHLPKKTETKLRKLIKLVRTKTQSELTAAAEAHMLSHVVASCAELQANPGTAVSTEDVRQMLAAEFEMATPHPEVKGASGSEVPPLVDVVGVTPLNDYSLLILFEDDALKRFDCSPYLREGTVFAALKQPEAFAKAYVDLGTVCWPGNVDIAPETLYDNGVAIETLAGVQLTPEQEVRLLAMLKQSPSREGAKALILLYETRQPDFKAFLGSMPDVGKDPDFERRIDEGLADIAAGDVISEVEATQHMADYMAKLALEHDAKSPARLRAQAELRDLRGMLQQTDTGPEPQVVANARGSWPWQFTAVMKWTVPPEWQQELDSVCAFVADVLGTELERELFSWLQASADAEGNLRLSYRSGIDFELCADDKATTEALLRVFHQGLSPVVAMEGGAYPAVMLTRDVRSRLDVRIAAAKEACKP